MPLGFTADELGGLPTTQYRFVLVTRLVVGTGIVALAAFSYEVYRGNNQFALDILNSWFLLLAGLAGLNVAQFGIKRGTDIGLATAKASGPGTNVASAPGGTVVQNTEGAPVTGERAAMRKSVAVVAPVPGPGDQDGHEWSSGDPRAGIL